MRVEVFKRTSDEWYPTSRRKLVLVLFAQTGPTPPIDGEWRVCVWGDDDFGMEKDFTDKDAAWECFLDVIKLEDVTVEAVKAMGFKPA